MSTAHPKHVTPFTDYKRRRRSLNVLPLFYTDPPAAVGLFDEGGNAVELEVVRIAITPDQFYVGTDDDGGPSYEITGVYLGVYQVRPTHALEAAATYELLVAMTEAPLEAPVVLTEHPGTSDTGMGPAPAGDRPAAFRWRGGPNLDASA